MSDARGPRILIVEDDQLLSGLISQGLQNSKFDIRTAFTGEEALTLAKEEKPDIMLLDIMLPGIDGFEVLSRIKQDAALKDIRVIILSNLGQQSDVTRGTELGAERYIVKVTLSLSEIVQMVKDVWQSHTQAPGEAARA